MNETCRRMERKARDLAGRILSWWLTYDVFPGGFHGAVDENNVPHPEANRGLILGARILWTLSEASRVLKDEKYRTAAGDYERYFRKAFADPRGGYWREISPEGVPTQPDKMTYANCFALYGLAAAARDLGSAEAKAAAERQFAFLEDKARDPEYGGYFEVLTPDGAWDRESRLGCAEDPSQVKTMNTSLHAIEAVTSFSRLEPEDPAARERLRSLFRLFTDTILDRGTMHFFQYFDRAWHPTDRRASYGHDIEGSWLLLEAAEVLGDPGPIREAKELAVAMTEASLAEGMSEKGFLRTEYDPRTGEMRPNYSWWEQNETVVAAFNAWTLSGKEEYLAAAERVLDGIREVFWDHEKGGYIPRIYDDLSPRPVNRADMWICPYHNVRMCLELIERINALS